MLDKMEKVEEDKFEKKIEEALKTTESIEQSIHEAVSAWEFLEITEQEYMQSLVSLIITPVTDETTNIVDGGDTAKSE